MTRKAFVQEPDRVPTWRLARIGVAALVAFAIGAAWAASVQRTSTGSVRGDTAPRPRAAGAPEVGMVFQGRFAASIANAKNDEARRRLTSAGWVDRDAGVVHVPIELSMDLVVQRGKL